MALQNAVDFVNDSSPLQELGNQLGSNKCSDGPRQEGGRVEAEACDEDGHQQFGVDGHERRIEEVSPKNEHKVQSFKHQFRGEILCIQVRCLLGNFLLSDFACLRDVNSVVEFSHDEHIGYFLIESTNLQNSSDVFLKYWQSFNLLTEIVIIGINHLLESLLQDPLPHLGSKFA